MAKLTVIEKELATEFKFEVAKMGGKIFYCQHNGMSVVILPNDRMGGFVRVYVAYCSPNDRFNEKRARLALRERVYNGNYILFPVAGQDFARIAESFMFIR